MTPLLSFFYAEWGEWFSQPVNEKMQLSKKVTGKSGYMPFGSEAPGYGPETDPKEYFHLKLERLDAFGDASKRVWWDCFRKALNWMELHGFRELNHPEWAEHAVLRILHYPPHPTGAVGQAHRDFDLLTVSVEGTAPGLEIWESSAKPDAKDAWLVHAPSEKRPRGGIEFGAWFPQEEGIQVGEMLEIYTDGGGCGDALHGIGLYQDATTHRVRTAPNTNRLKGVFFFLPPMDFELRPGFTAHDYLLGPKGVLRKAGTA